MHMADFELSQKTYICTLFISLIFIFGYGVNFLFFRNSYFFVSYLILMFLGSKMGYLGIPNGMAQARGPSAHSVAL